MRLPVLVVLSAVVANSCSSSKNGQSEEKTAGDARTVHTKLSALAQAQRIAPNHCRILGTIVAIDSTIITVSDGADPCSKAPCRATVRIDSIIGYGSAFFSPLSMGQAIPVSFTFTIAPTRRLLPDINPPYPGLDIGSHFIADVEAREAISTGNIQSARYSINGYTVINDP